MGLISGIQSMINSPGQNFAVDAKKASADGFTLEEATKLHEAFLMLAPSEKAVAQKDLAQFPGLLAFVQQSAPELFDAAAAQTKADAAALAAITGKSGGASQGGAYDAAHAKSLKATENDAWNRLNQGVKGWQAK